MSKNVRTLSIHKPNGEAWNISEIFNGGLIYTLHFEGRTPRLNLARAFNGREIVGSATYQVRKQRLSKIVNISLSLSTISSLVSLNRKGGLFNSDRRILNTTALGLVEIDSQVGSNPWKDGAPETTWVRCKAADGRTLVTYVDERFDTKRMGHLDIQSGLSQEALDQLVLAAMAVLFLEKVR